MNQGSDTFNKNQDQPRNCKPSNSDNNTNLIIFHPKHQGNT
jgi:hypothetical protein